MPYQVRLTNGLTEWLLLVFTRTAERAVEAATLFYPDWSVIAVDGVEIKSDVVMPEPCDAVA